MKPVRVFYNLIALQTDDSEKLKSFVNHWVKPNHDYQYPIDFAKYFGIDVDKIPTNEELNAFDLLRSVELLTDSYRDLADDVLISLLNEISNTFNYINDKVNHHGDSNPIEIYVKDYTESVNIFKADINGPMKIDDIISLTNVIMGKIRRLSVNVTGFDFSGFIPGEELNEKFDLVDDDVINLLATLLTPEELAVTEAECLSAYMDDNTFVLALPSKNDSLVDFVHDVSAKYDLQANLYFGDGQTVGHIVSTAGVTEFDHKEPERRTLLTLLDAVGLSEYELGYFNHFTTDVEEEIDPVAEGAFGVN